MGSGAVPEALQSGLPSVLEADSINLAAAAMVTGANCRLAQAPIFGGTCKAGVTRDYQSQPDHSGARRAEKGALLEHLRARRTVRRDACWQLRSRSSTASSGDKFRPEKCSSLLGCTTLLRSIYRLARSQRAARPSGGRLDRLEYGGEERFPSPASRLIPTVRSSTSVSPKVAITLEWPVV